MNVQFLNTDEWKIDKKGFDKFINRLIKHVPDAEGVLNVVFVDDAYIQALNNQYRDKDEPTDVLSFSYLDAMNGDVIGEIYISVPTAKAQAKEFKHPLSDELNKLFVHGFLHVFGHDHEKDEDYKKMKAIEDEVLKR